jgi:hypothetical protein
VKRTLDEIWDGCTLLNFYWNGIMKQGDFFIAIYLAYNEYGLVFFHHKIHEIMSLEPGDRGTLV